VQVVVTVGGLRLTRYLAPRGVTDHPMGLRNHGDDPVALAQARCPCARVDDAHHDISALIVPGGAGIAAQFDPVGMRTSDRTGPVSSLEAPAAQGQNGSGWPERAP
jgi:hypothetical protein